MIRLYLDMDGVLMDYEAAIQASGVKRYREGAHWISRPRAEWPAEMVQADKEYVAAMEHPDFWPSLKPMADAHQLWTFCQQFSPQILTAAPSDRPGETKFAAIRDRIAQQKRESIWKCFDTVFPATSIHVCLRHEKANYARSGAVLVDDTPGNCAEWEARGGTAILHKTAAETIYKLTELLMSAKPDVARMVGADRNAKPALRQRNSAERKAEPLHTGVMLYFPDALAAIARLSKAGNDKHNPGQPLHWSRGKSADHSDCVARHSLTPLLVDPETGEIEAVAKAWRTLAELQLLEERRLTAAGIMPYSGVTP
jgi:hypothetical protein